MRVRLVRRPGQAGTREYVAQYGTRLICVRHRYDSSAKRCYKTVEIIVEEGPWAPPFRPEMLVAVRVGLGETEVQRMLRQAGATWERQWQVWHSATGSRSPLALLTASWALWRICLVTDKVALLV